MAQNFSDNFSERVISPNSVAFGADYIKVVEGTSIVSATEM